jgi:predicted ester cyclase
MDRRPESGGRRPDLEAVSRRDFREVWHERDLDAIGEIYHENYRGHDFPLVAPLSRRGYRLFADLFLRAFPDVEFTVHELRSEGRTVHARWSLAATHSGRLFGVPPSGADIDAEGRGRHRYRDGRVAETRLDFEWRRVARQVAAGYLARVRAALPGGGD